MEYHYCKRQCSALLCYCQGILRAFSSFNTKMSSGKLFSGNLDKSSWKIPWAIIVFAIPVYHWSVVWRLQSSRYANLLAQTTHYAITKGKYLRKHTLIRKTASKNILMFFDKEHSSSVYAYHQAQSLIKEHFSSQKCSGKLFPEIYRIFPENMSTALYLIKR